MIYCTYDTKCQNPIIIEKLIEERELLKQKIEQLKEHNKYVLDLIKAERRRQEECDDVHLRNIATLEKENEQLKQKLDWFLTETIAGKEYRPKEELEELQQENEQLTLQIEKMKNWCNCKNYQECLIELAEQGKGMKPSECCVNCKKWELKESKRISE